MKTSEDTFGHDITPLIEKSMCSVLDGPKRSAKGPSFRTNLGLPTTLSVCPTVNRYPALFRGVEWEGGEENECCSASVLHCWY